MVCIRGHNWAHGVHHFLRCSPAIFNFLIGGMENRMDSPHQELSISAYSFPDYKYFNFMFDWEEGITHYPLNRTDLPKKWLTGLPFKNG
ncbi:hypothetical protein OUZ56_011818 [Daphnia magna]|uniref:Uncharacterized protein n=1 Tax=Daphnia magna TaxID=35525 RepID=A0ABQ9Z184_9CRUS|nr:hypothetical protein OUZ56_011818 [Daphnia magna]